MPHFIKAFDTVRITVQFRDWDVDGDFGEPIDPEEVNVRVYNDENEVLAGYPKPADAAGPVGEFHYDWTPLQAGVFLVEFIGEFEGGVTTIIKEEFFVETPSPHMITLGEDQELVFLTELEPLYVDPEEFIPHFTEASLVEITELVHRYSLQVDQIFGDRELTFLAYEYIRAAVLCALSRIYDYGAGGDENSITLGDLSITSRASLRQRVTKANAVSWCELAAVLYEDLIRGNANIKGVVRGSRIKNPMPKRRVRDQYAPKGRRGR